MFADSETAEFLGRQVSVERELGRRSFIDFYKMAWRVMDPEPFVDGRHIRVICYHLQRAARREIQQLVICIPPRYSKPVYEEEAVLTARGRIPLRDVVVGDRVLTHLGRFRAVEAVHVQGDLPTLIVNAWSGRSARVAPDHPFLTTRGWIQAKDLVPGDIAGIARITEECGSDTISDEEARLLGYLIGDGSVTHKHIHITALDPTEVADIQACAKALGIRTSIGTKAGTAAVKIGLLNTVAGSHVERAHLANLDRVGPTQQLIDRAELQGKNSYTKRVPISVMTGSLRVVAQFLGAYWACDGFITKRGYDRDGNVRRDTFVGCDTVSRGLAFDIQHLLYRLGVNARVRRKLSKIVTKKQGELYTSYTVSMTSSDWVARFAAMVKIPHTKQWLLDHLKGRTDFDRPIWRDEVVSVEVADPVPCRCLTVAEDHSFTAGDLIVHNSLMCSVAFPAWVWTWWPAAKFITSSYGQQLATRDALASRRLVESPWYQDRWPEVQFMGDQHMKTHYQTSAGGVRFVGSPGSGVTGHGADFALFDDPHDITSSESDAERDEARRYWFETMSGRFNNPIRGVSLVIQQRVHEKDVAGECIRRGYYHCILPARFERAHPQRHEFDWRIAEGEPLWPEKFSEAVLSRLWSTLGGADGYAVAGQQQQRPAPREGSLFKRHWFKIMEALPASIVWVRAWDTAATEQTGTEDPDWTVGVKVGFHPPTKSYIVGNVVRDRLDPGGVDAMILNTARLDGRDVAIFLPQDPGAAGKSDVLAKVKNLAGYVVKTSPMTGSKTVRATPLASQASVGNVFLYRADWNEDFLAEVCSFPTGLHDDQVDAVACGFNLFIDSTSGLLDFFSAQAASVKEAEEALRESMGLVRVVDYQIR